MPDGDAARLRGGRTGAVTFDHRALDGADATRFAVAVKARLESRGASTSG